MYDAIGIADQAGGTETETKTRLVVRPDPTLYLTLYIVVLCSVHVLLSPVVGSEMVNLGLMPSGDKNRCSDGHDCRTRASRIHA